VSAPGATPPRTLHGEDTGRLPHHGSENNAELSLFKWIRADHYVVSADGIKHAHPSEATLEWLVATRGADEHYTIHLTNAIPAAQTKLQKLAAGRSFEVSVGAPKVAIALA